MKAAKQPSARKGSILDHTLVIAYRIAQALLFFVFVGINASTIMRYFISRPIAWMSEITEFIIVAVVFLSAAFLLKNDDHIRVDILYNVMSEKARETMGVINNVLMIGIFTVCCYFTAATTWEHYVRNVNTVTSISFPKYILFLVMTIGFLLLLLEAVALLYRRLRKKPQDALSQTAPQVSGP